MLPAAILASVFVTAVLTVVPEAGVVLVLMGVLPFAARATTCRASAS